MWEVMYWWSACLQDDTYYNMLCFTGRHFLLDDMFYLRVCIIEGHVLQLEMSIEGQPSTWLSQAQNIEKIFFTVITYLNKMNDQVMCLYLCCC